MKDVKIVAGANYGDEGKGLLARHFAQKALADGKTPLVILHNGTAQRGHTVDYSENFRHVYHHFGSGTADGVSTYFASTFLIHPMEFAREYKELVNQGICVPKTFYDPKAMVITPLDMAVDHATEEWIAQTFGEREYASCGFGSWCAVEDRLPFGTNYSIGDFRYAAHSPEMMNFIMDDIWKACLGILAKRGVDIEKTSLRHLVKDRGILIKNFTKDVQFFLSHSVGMPFDWLYNNTVFNSLIFENGQGLGLDKNVDNDWHTTSNTGVINPYGLLKDKDDFSAEVCYVSRSYLTRHGFGPLEEKVQKKEINADMHDKTNVFNDFQGDLRYGYLEDADQKKRIEKDFAVVSADPRFKYSMAITHTNEFDCGKDDSKYYSDSPYEVKERF